MELSRRTFLKASALLPASVSRRPNFLVILADDMGYSDAGCYGGDIDTPNLDALASRGVRFTQAYSTARCGPSRSCLLTGHYAQQTACDVMTPGNIPAWTRFAPQYLKDLGYRSYHSGKWHIRFRPLSGAGFEHSYLLQDQNRFFTPAMHYLDDQPLPAVKESDGYYATKAIADHAIKTLRNHDARDPFFHYLAFTSPHFPLHALQEDIREYQDRFADGWDTSREKRHARLRRMGLVNCGLPPLERDMRPSWNTSDADLLKQIGPGEVMHAAPWSTLSQEQKKFQRMKMAIHAAMITRMDREIGRVLAQLKAMKAYDNTLILFLSDNGASSEQLIRGDGHDATAPAGSGQSHLCLGPGWASAANTPFRLHKSWVHEGGISSPLIAHWPNHIKDAGELRHTPCHFIDVLPTLVELAGGKLSAFPGSSFAPALARDVRIERDYIYFNHSNNRALRVEDEKIVAAGISGPWELYDLKSDRSELRNLSAANSKRVEQLSAQWSRIDAELVRTREAATPFPKDAPGLQRLGGRTSGAAL